MTAFAASVLRVAKRGQLTAGMYSDIIVFDPARVHARASYTAPLVLAEGFELVIVNGIIAREVESLSGKRAGRVLQPELQ